MNKRIYTVLTRSFSNDKYKSPLDIFEKEFHNLERSNLAITNKESLLIYRDCVKLCKRFYWYNDTGKQWSEVLSKSVRKDFENNRNIDDTVESGKKQVQARQAIIELEYKLFNVNNDINKFIHNTKVEPRPKEPEGKKYNLKNIK